MTPASGPARQEAKIAAIRARHEDFERRYSPGPDWEPFNQTHRDRGTLLALLAPAEARPASVAERLVNVEGGRIQYQNCVYFHRIVDVVRHAEADGRDGLDVLGRLLVQLSQNNAKNVEAAIDKLERTGERTTLPGFLTSVAEARPERAEMICEECGAFILPCCPNCGAGDAR